MDDPETLSGHPNTAHMAKLRRDVDDARRALEAADEPHRAEAAETLRLAEAAHRDYHDGFEGKLGVR